MTETTSIAIHNLIRDNAKLKIIPNGLKSLVAAAIIQRKAAVKSKKAEIIPLKNFVIGSGKEFYFGLLDSNMVLKKQNYCSK